MILEVLAPQVHQLVKLEQIHTTTCKMNSAAHKLAPREQISTKAMRERHVALYVLQKNPFIFYLKLCNHGAALHAGPTCQLPTQIIKTI
jgi:hypothetical protein